MLLEGMRVTKTSGVDAVKALDVVFGKDYIIQLHQSAVILDNHTVFYPQALYNNLVCEPTLVAASQVVKGSDTSKLVYKLTNIQIEFETMHSLKLADKATCVYNSCQEFTYDHIM